MVDSQKEGGPEPLLRVGNNLPPNSSHLSHARYRRIRNRRLNLLSRDGQLYFVEIASGRIGYWSPESGVTRIAETTGGPNGATLGSNGPLYVAQNGGMRRKNRVTPGIQRVSLDGRVEMITTEVAGLALEGPNDLAFGPGGRLYFTDPRGASDPAANSKPGQFFAWDVDAKQGELLIELGPVFANRTGFSAD